MKQIISVWLERLFEKVPFSQRSETLREDLEKTLNQEFDERKDKGENEVAIIRDLLEDGETIETLACKYACPDENIKEIISTENILGLQEVKKYFQKYKRYAIILSLCGMFLWNLFYGTIFYYSFPSRLLNLALATVIIVCMWIVFKKKKRFLADTDFFARKMDADGKIYTKKMYDRYAKKTINSICLLITFLFYSLFAYVHSVLSSRYNMNDIMQQISRSSSIFILIAFLMAKNVICIFGLEKFFVKERAERYGRHLKKIILYSSVGWLICDSILLLFFRKSSEVFNVYFFTMFLYSIVLLVYNLTIRNRLVFKNIVINVRRITAVSMVVIIIGLYTVMSSDNYFTQPYINKVSVVEHHDNPISYNEETGVYTITTDKNDFKILQLTDIHLGGSLFSARQDLKALDACYKLIEASRPDFVVVTGDMVFPMGIMSFSLNNKAPMEQFAAFMRNIGIPWAFTYGNHDTEAMACITADEFDGLMKSLSFKSSANLLYPYIQPDIYGRSNQMIEIRNADGTLMQALFLMDSNDYIPDASGINEYDYIRDDQVEWYKKNVLALQEQERKDIDSMIFFHIPLQEYKTANDLYEDGSDQATYYYGELGEDMIDKICCSTYSSRLFETAVKLGSTRAMFCGHDHYNNQSLEYKGIRLTYGYSIDYLAMPGIEDDVEQRGATLITIDKSGDFEITPYRMIDIQ